MKLIMILTVLLFSWQSMAKPCRNVILDTNFRYDAKRGSLVLDTQNNIRNYSFVKEGKKEMHTYEVNENGWVKDELTFTKGNGTAKLQKRRVTNLWEDIITDKFVVGKTGDCYIERRSQELVSVFKGLSLNLKRGRTYVYKDIAFCERIRPIIQKVGKTSKQCVDLINEINKAIKVTRTLDYSYRKGVEFRPSWYKPSKEELGTPFSAISSCRELLADKDEYNKRDASAKRISKKNQIKTKQ